MNRATAILACAAGLSLLSTACGGPNLQFDPKPVPPWVKETNSDVSGREIRAVGAAPATINLQRDADLAQRDAKARVAQLFESQVVSRSTDWSMALASGEKSTEKTMSQQSVEVRSNVTVEDARVESTYRDEETGTHYVLVTVDRPAWTRRLEGRLNDGFAELDRAAAGARAAVDGGQPLVAYGQLVAAYDAGKKLEPDVVVVDLLDTARGVRARLLEAKRNLEETGKGLRARFPFAVEVACSDRAAGQRLAASLESFFKERGFRVEAAAKGSVRVKATIGERLLKTETVAGRKEQVHVANGRLQVIQPSGAEITELAVVIEGDSYEERDTDAARAAEKALTLAADTLAAKFRSAYRSLYREQ